MYIKLTRLRLTLAAALIVGGVAAPLAYATIGNAGKAGNAPAQKPTRIVTPVVQAGKTVTGAASAPTAVGDPYQLVLDLSKDRAGEQCHFGCSGVAAGHELGSRRVALGSGRAGGPERGALQPVRQRRQQRDPLHESNR